MFLELGGFDLISICLKGKTERSKLLDQSLVSILLNILVVDPEGGRGAASAEDWLDLARSCVGLLGLKPYKPQTADDKTCFAVISSFAAIIANRYNSLLNVNDVLNGVVCEFLDFGRRASADDDSSWIEIEEMWLLTCQAFLSTIKSSKTARDSVSSSGWIKSWKDARNVDPVVEQEISSIIKAVQSN